MCGIVGLYLKNPKLEPQLGSLLSKMLETMTDRGPDSAGFAVYGSDSAGVKLTLRGPDQTALSKAVSGLEEVLKRTFEKTERDTHTVISVPAEREEQIRTWLKANAPGIDVVSAGRRMEIYKEVGLPAKVAERFDLAGMTGHARHRPHPDGDRERRHHERRPPVLDRHRRVPRP